MPIHKCAARVLEPNLQTAGECRQILRLANSGGDGIKRPVRTIVSGKRGPAIVTTAELTRLQENMRQAGVNRARAVFFDRDGTLMEEVHYCGDPTKVVVFPGVPEALRKLKGAGFRTIVITNQSGIGRGLITKAQYQVVEAEFLSQIGEGLLDATYFCPDVPSIPSTRRKPEPGMVWEAAVDFDIDLAGSYFVGDKSIDIECGRRAGAHTILVRTGYGAEQVCQPDFTADDVVQAVHLVLERLSG